MRANIVWTVGNELEIHNDRGLARAVARRP